MKSEFVLRNLIKEILNEFFIKSRKLDADPIGTKINIIFQDNKISLEKISDKKQKVLSIENDGRIKVDDILEFINNEIDFMKPECFIFRKNKGGKMMKTKLVHQFSFVKSINEL